MEEAKNERKGGSSLKRTRKPFGEQLAEFMETRNLRRRTVCTDAGIDKSLLSRFVNGVRVPSPWRAFQMGWDLGVALERRRIVTTLDGRRLVAA